MRKCSGCKATADIGAKFCPKGDCPLHETCESETGNGVDYYFSDESLLENIVCIVGQIIGTLFLLDE